MKRVHRSVNLTSVPINVNIYTSVGVFTNQAKEQGWSEYEINLAITEAKSKNFHHFLKTILNYCETENDTRTTPQSVREILYQLGLHTHYLGTKPIENWDEYDYSNYRSLLIKSGKIKLKNMQEHTKSMHSLIRRFLNQRNM